MKKLILTMIVAMCAIYSSFASTGFNKANTSGWPNLLFHPTQVSSAYRIVGDATYYYAITEDQGIWRIAKANIASGTGWSAFNSGLPAAGLIGGVPFYSLGDMDICGTYLYVLCTVSGSSSQAIYRVDLSSSSTFSPVTPSTALLSGETYAIKAAGSYVFIANQADLTTCDIRYSLNSTTTWTSLTLNPSSTTPSYIYSINALVVSGRFDLHFCAYNGLFIKGLSSTGAPTGGQGLITALADCPRIEYLYDASGVFTWAYLSQMATTVPGHKAPIQMIRIQTGSSTPSSVTMTPTNTNSIGQITSLSSWQGNAHFGVESSASSLTDVLYKGDNTANNFVVSSLCDGTNGVSGTVGTVCMYTDGTTRLLAGEYGNGVWYATNTGCKTDQETGINELDQDHIKIYPVPATNEMTINYHTENGEQPTVVLYDMEGRLQSPVINFTRVGEIKMNVASLSKGVYTLEFNNGTKITQRVVVE